MAIITVKSIEKNSGSTTIALMLANCFSRITDENTVVIDMDVDNPEISSILEPNSLKNNNIDNIMTYGCVDNTDLTDAINANTIELTNSRLKVVYGTNFINNQFNEIQVSNIVKTLKSSWPFAVIDIGSSSISDILKNNSDILLVTVDYQRKAIQKLAIMYRDLIDLPVTEVLVNRFFKGNHLSAKAIEAMIGKKVFAMLPYDKEVVETTNNTRLDLSDENLYGKYIQQMAEQILLKLGLVQKEKSFYIFRALWK